MPDNLVCEKCGHRFNSQQELQKHAQHCAGKGAQQGGSMTHGAGGNNPAQ